MPTGRESMKASVRPVQGCVMIAKPSQAKFVPESYFMAGGMNKCTTDLEKGHT
jgi:hypothetical protein